MQTDNKAILCKTVHVIKLISNLVYHMSAFGRAIIIPGIHSVSMLSYYWIAFFMAKINKFIFDHF